MKTQKNDKERPKERTKTQSTTRRRKRRDNYPLKKKPPSPPSPMPYHPALHPTLQKNATYLYLESERDQSHDPSESTDSELSVPDPRGRGSSSLGGRSTGGGSGGGVAG